MTMPRRLADRQRPDSEAAHAVNLNRARRNTQLINCRLVSDAAALERGPGRLRREFEVADVGAEPKAQPGADRYHYDVIGGQRRHAEAADEVGRAVDAEKALVDGMGRRQLVDEHHGARAFAAEIPPDRGSLPEHFQIAGVLGVEHALAI